MRATAFSDVSSYSYYETGYANPDAITQLANGLSTTTFHTTMTGTSFRRRSTEQLQHTSTIMQTGSLLSALAAQQRRTVMTLLALASFRRVRRQPRFILSSGTASRRRPAQVRNIPPRPTTFSTVKLSSQRSIGSLRAAWRPGLRRRIIFIPITSAAPTWLRTPAEP
jgi:hypothetical protein